MEELRVKDLEKKFEKGFKVDFSKVQRAIKKCSTEKNDIECKKIFSDLGIEIYD